MIQDIFRRVFMRTYSIRAVLALAAVLVISSQAAAQNIIRGTVVDGDGQPIEGAAVAIQAVEGIRGAETATNARGQFSQIGLASGLYNVTVTKDDFKQVQEARVSLSAPVNLEFRLTPTSGLTREQIQAQEERQGLAQSALEAMREGRDAEAILMFGEILVDSPTCSDCHYNLAVAHSKLGQYAEAEASFQTAIALAPDSGTAYTGLANVYNAQKKFDLAQQASAKAAELTAASGGGSSAEALYNQGVIAWNAGNFAEAKEQFDLAVAADPALAMGHYQLGMANLNLGQIPEARQAFETYLEVDPGGEKAAEVKVFVEQLPQ
jgi:tetratricopeptide (TPR) repeat protein